MMKQFQIKQNSRGFYEVWFGKRRISTADTHLEAAKDIEKYQKQIEDYIDTGIMSDWRVAVFFS